MTASTNNVSGYIDYFRQLAVNHIDLLHNPGSETGDAPEATQHFTKISIEEVVSGLRSKVGWPLLTLELYENDFYAEIELDVKQRSKGAFMVVQNPVSKNFRDEQACYETSEKIAYDFLRQIWQDHYGFTANRCVTPFRFVFFNSIIITPVGPVFSGQFGYRV
jgi:hypothetical protein